MTSQQNQSNEELDEPSCGDRGCRLDSHNKKLLPCLHVVCVEYLKKSCGGARTRAALRCPVCPKPTKFTVPNRNVENLPDNFLGVRLEEVLRIREKERSGRCEICERTVQSEIGLRSGSYCMDCRQYMCSECVGLHGKMRLAKGHRVLGGCDDYDPRELLRSWKRNCGVHRNQVERLYCMQCQHPICSTCYAAGRHRKHPIRPLKRIAEAERNRISEDLAWIQDALSCGNRFLDDLKEEKTRFLENIDAVKKEIVENAERLSAENSSRAARLREEVRFYGESRMEEISQMVEDEESLLALPQLVDLWKEVVGLIPMAEVAQVEDQVAEVLRGILVTWLEFHGGEETEAASRWNHFRLKMDDLVSDDPDTLSHLIGQLFTKITEQEQR